MTSKATYSFNELIERIYQAQDREELLLICSVVREEQKEYSHFHLRLIVEAVGIRRRELRK